MNEKVNQFLIELKTLEHIFEKIVYIDPPFFNRNNHIYTLNFNKNFQNIDLLLQNQNVILNFEIEDFFKKLQITKYEIYNYIRNSENINIIQKYIDTIIKNKKENKINKKDENIQRFTNINQVYNKLNEKISINEKIDFLNKEDKVQYLLSDNDLILLLNSDRNVLIDFINKIRKLYMSKYIDREEKIQLNKYLKYIQIFFDIDLIKQNLNYDTFKLNLNNELKRLFNENELKEIYNMPSLNKLFINFYICIQYRYIQSNKKNSFKFQYITGEGMACLYRSISYIIFQTENYHTFIKFFLLYKMYKYQNIKVFEKEDEYKILENIKLNDFYIQNEYGDATNFILLSKYIYDIDIGIIFSQDNKDKQISIYYPGKDGVNTYQNNINKLNDYFNNNFIGYIINLNNNHFNAYIKSE